MDQKMQLWVFRGTVSIEGTGVHMEVMYVAIHVQTKKLDARGKNITI